MSAYILLGFRLDSFQVFWNALVIVIPFLSFKGTTNVYILKILITSNKNLIPLLNLLINCISARSAPKILSLNREQTLLLLNFVIISLCNSFANYLLEIVPPEVFFIKTIIDHRGKTSSIFVIFWILSNIKCFIS